jgi:hypothetical protein
VWSTTGPRLSRHRSKQKGRIAHLRRQAAGSDGRLTRLCDAIENGLADLDDASLKGRTAELKQITDVARADADRAEARLADADATVTPEKVRALAAAARRKLRKTDGGCRRHHLRLLAQQIEVTRARSASWERRPPSWLRSPQRA